MKIDKLIAQLCDGDNNRFRQMIYVKKIADWYNGDFKRQKDAYFKKYAKECLLATRRLNGLGK